jgi:hypothetical protein
MMTWQLKRGIVKRFVFKLNKNVTAALAIIINRKERPTHLQQTLKLHSDVRIDGCHVPICCLWT